MSGVALVTGANRGLGRETCLRLARTGKHVLLTARSLEAATEAVAELRAEFERGSIEALELDVTDDASIGRAFEHVVGSGERLDVLVNNAGVAFDGFDADVARRTIEVNLFGAERTTYAFASIMTDGGRVVMVSSESGTISRLSEALRERFCDPALDRAGLHALVNEFIEDVMAERSQRSGWPTSAYAVSKAAMNALTRIAARDLPHLRINAVSPGWVRTRMGGSGAPRSLAEGAGSIVWATGVDVPTGGFFRDGRRIPW